MKANTKAKIKNFFIPNIVYVLLAGLIVRLLFSVFGTLKLDQGTFISWSNILAQDGFKYFYNSWSDYLPGYLYVLWALGKIQIVLPDFFQVILYKLPAILSDVITGYLIYKILLRVKTEKWGLIGASIYLFNPAIFANSTLWGQVDSLTALSIILSIYLVPSRYILSAAILSLGTLIKPQAAFVFPVILFMSIKLKKKITDILAYCATGLAIFVLGFVPFWNHGNLISFIFQRLEISLNQYPYTSVNAFNFWGLTGFWKQDALYSQIFGYLFVTAISIFTAIKLWKKEKQEYFLAAVIMSASFLFMTRMHERHLLPALAPLAISVSGNPFLLIPYMGFSLVYLANLAYSYNWITNDFMSIFPPILIKLIILVNTTSFGILVATLINPERVKSFFMSMVNIFEKKRTATKPYQFNKITISATRAKWLLIGILAFAFITRIFNLGNPPNEYFDEVYHAYTAKVILSPEANKAWEWWNTPPPGFAYEWTHPPLAKLGMAFGMVFFGQNSFGYRIPGALLGVGSVLLVYLIAKKLFKDEVVGLLSAAVFSLDGLALVMSRIGMNDTYLLFFVLLSTYFFLKENNLASALAFGFALSSKWSAVWVIPILFVIWLKQKNKFRLSLMWFLILPFAVYLSTYTQMFLTGHDMSTWWGMQKQMWWYHTGLRATHPYTSSWWSWPLLIRPIYLYTSDEIGGWVSRIYAFGNPPVFWFGLTSVIIGFIYAFVEKNKRLGLIIFSYLIFFTPWAASPRIMFLYHYLPSMPFLAIATGYLLRRNSKMISTFLFICLLFFVYFYPHWAGLNIPVWLDRSYYWISSWR